jgi:NADPH:quinone reductase-like Zn-dependent oxidoreductase
VTESTAGKLIQLSKLLLHTPWYNPLGLMNANKSVFGVNLGHMWGEREKISGWMHEILKGIDQGWIRPHVDRAFPFEQAGEAHAYIEERRNTGKVVLVADG